MSRTERTARGFAHSQKTLKEARIDLVIAVVRRAGKVGITPEDVRAEVATRITRGDEVSRSLSRARARGFVVRDGRNGVDHRWYAVDAEKVETA